MTFIEMTFVVDAIAIAIIAVLGLWWLIDAYEEYQREEEYLAREADMYEAWLADPEAYERKWKEFLGA